MSATWGVYRACPKHACGRAVPLACMASRRGIQSFCHACTTIWPVPCLEAQRRAHGDFHGTAPNVAIGPGEVHALAQIPGAQASLVADHLDALAKLDLHAGKKQPRSRSLGWRREPLHTKMIEEAPSAAPQRRAARSNAPSWPPPRSAQRWKRRPAAVSAGQVVDRASPSMVGGRPCHRPCCALLVLLCMHGRAMLLAGESARSPAAHRQCLALRAQRQACAGPLDAPACQGRCAMAHHAQTAHGCRDAAA